MALRTFSATGPLRPSAESPFGQIRQQRSTSARVSNHVDLVSLEPAGIGIEVSLEVEPEHHVTTERLKDQFEERLAARTGRSRSVRP
jgi:hypothetical protein